MMFKTWRHLSARGLAGRRLARRRRTVFHPEWLEDRTLLSVPTHIVIGQQPTSTNAGQVVNPAVTVLLEDQFNKVVTSSTQNVSLAIQNNPSAGTLSGTTTQAASGGVATFNNLSINQAGAGYTLTASAMVSSQPTPTMGVTFDTGTGVVGGEIPVTSYTWSGESTGAPAPQVEDFQMVLSASGAEPEVWGVMVTNTSFRHVILHVRTPDQAQLEYLTYTFTNVTINRFLIDSPAGTKDAISLDFGRVEEDYGASPAGRHPGNAGASILRSEPEYWRSERGRRATAGQHAAIGRNVHHREWHQQ